MRPWTKKELEALDGSIENWKAYISGEILEEEMSCALCRYVNGRSCRNICPINIFMSNITCGNSPYGVWVCLDVESKDSIYWAQKELNFLQAVRDQDLETATYIMQLVTREVENEHS